MPIPRSIRPVLTPPSNRADARRNHDRLLRAANEVFDERGVDASLDEIARRAGLGSGTLYRHFPTRDALMSALFWERIETLCDEGDELMAAPEPTEALILWVRKLIGLTMRQGLAQALVARQQEQSSALFDACRQALDATGTPLLDRAKADGGIRPDLAMTDLLTFAHLIAAALEQADHPPGKADDLLHLLTDGLRTRDGSGCADRPRAAGLRDEPVGRGAAR